MLSMVRHAMRFYPNATRKQRASQAVKWALAIAFLGDKWILSRRIEKLDEPRPV